MSGRAADVSAEAELRAFKVNKLHTGPTGEAAVAPAVRALASADAIELLLGLLSIGVETILEATCRLLAVRPRSYPASCELSRET